MSSLIKQCSVRSLKAPLNQPFRVATGQHNTLDNLLFALELSDGTKGWGEAAVATHITGETVPATRKNLEHIARDLIGKEAGEYLKISEGLHEQFPRNQAAVAAVETALMDALTRQWNIPLWRFFGNKPQKFQTDITVVIGSLEETEQSVSAYYRRGFRTFKVKIGRDYDLDLKRVQAVHRLSHGARIILDANQGFSAEGILRFLKELAQSKIRPVLLEQPVPQNDWAGLKKITRSTTIPVCADESASSLKDVIQIIKTKAVKAINIKLMKTGLFHAHKIAILAQANNIKLMIGGMMESSLAMTASAHLAAGVGGFDFVDLDTPFFIKKGYERNPCLNSSGIYDLSNVPKGIGIIPSGKMISKR